MKVKTNYMGVILAAGRGTRIYPLNHEYPKPFLPICNKPIIEYQIECMKELGIYDLVIVCGHLKDRIKSAFGDGSKMDVSIQYVKQDNPLGIAHALAKVEPFVSKPFLLFLGDIFFIPINMNQMLEIYEQKGAHGVLGIKKEENPEYIKRNFSVILHESGMVKRVIEKPRYTQTNLKGCGIYFFDLSIFDAIRTTPKTAMRDEYEITSSIQILIDEGYPVYTAEVIEWDFNITTTDDLLICNRKMLEYSKNDNIFGEGIDIHPKAEINKSVIGDRVIIENPIRIINSVILNDSRVSLREDLINVLVSKDKILHFQNKNISYEQGI